MKIILKYLALLLIISINTSLYAQKMEDVVKNRMVVITTVDSTVKAFILNHKIDIKPDNKLSYYWYRNNQVNKNQGGYSGYLLDGCYEVYDNDKNMLKKGTFKKGLKTGIWKSWDKEGNLFSEIHWDKGQKDGKEIIYTNGKKAINYYKNGEETDKSGLGLFDLLKSDNKEKPEKDRKTQDTTNINEYMDNQPQER